MHPVYFGQQPAAFRLKVPGQVVAVRKASRCHSPVTFLAHLGTIYSNGLKAQRQPALRGKTPLILHQAGC